MKKLTLFLLLLCSITINNLGLAFDGELAQISKFNGRYILANGSFFCPPQLVININIEKDMISIGNGNQIFVNYSLELINRGMTPFRWNSKRMEHKLDYLQPTTLFYTESVSGDKHNTQFWMSLTLEQQGRQYISYKSKASGDNAIACSFKRV